MPISFKNLSIRFLGIAFQYRFDGLFTKILIFCLVEKY